MGNVTVPQFQVQGPAMQRMPAQMPQAQVQMMQQNRMPSPPQIMQNKPGPQVPHSTIKLGQ